jgi:DNA-binding MarR family transcriptional regulator
MVALTAQGEEILLRLLPQWEQLQAHMVAGMQQEQFAAFLAQLSDLTARTQQP